MLKRIKIDEQLHRRVKATAALHGATIKEWVEAVLEDALDGRYGASVLVDERGQYIAQEGQDNA